MVLMVGSQSRESNVRRLALRPEPTSVTARSIEYLRDSDQVVTAT
jgi:hypothetical protein